MALLDGVERLRGSLDYHLARHNLLTANLAQVDTPGFKPQDLKRPGAFGEVLQAELTATAPGHFGTPAGSLATGAPGAGGAASASAQFEVVTDTSEAAGPDGNAVNLDREAVKIAANHLRYEVLAQLTSGELSSLSWAANDGRTV
jgi:flagellar basal-body rod protein FlgB